MNIRLFLCTTLSFAIILSCGTLHGANASTGREITVAGITGENPVEFISGQFGPSGVYVDLWKLWSEKTGIKVNYVIMQRGEAEKSLLANNIDVIMDYTPSRDSENNISVIPEICTSDVFIYRKRGIPQVETFQELLPYRVGVMKDDMFHMDEVNCDISFFIKDAVSDLFTASENGEINLFLARASLANYELAVNGKWKNFIQSFRPLYSIGVSAAVRSTDKELQQQIESGFRSISATERVVIEKSWSGGNIRYRIPWGFIAVIVIIAAVIGGVVVIWWWNFQLQRKVDEATEELKAMKEEAEAANLAKSRFLDNISHELRTPLTLILAPVESALNGKQMGTDTLEMIRRNSRNLLSLINDLLELSRITAGKMKLKVSETDICSAVRLYCAEMESAAEYSGISLTCSVPDSPLNVYVDRGKFSGIISNFFSNSLKFTEQGGWINISLEQGDGEVLLRFSDTGPGIPPDKISTIFDRFSQAEVTLSRSHEGTGIGLSIVKEIAELHGGSVSVSSRYIEQHPDDHCAEFTVRIPSGVEHLQGREDVEFIERPDEVSELPFIRGIVKSRMDQSGIGIHDDPHQEDRASVLIVEDNADMRYFLEALLETDYKVYTASNGAEALEILSSFEEIDLVLSDMMMPVMDGHELLERIKSDGRISDIPVLFLTARNDDLVKHQGLELGAVDYIVKPFNPDELLLRVRNQMQLGVMRSNLQRRNDELYEKLRNRVQHDSGKSAVSDVMKQRMESVCLFIAENYRNDITRDKIAATIGLNPDLFSRVFNQHTGSTLPEYINSFRVEEAKTLLAGTDRTVTRISIETGFENLRTFNRVFKKITGVTPSEFRERREAKNS